MELDFWCYPGFAPWVIGSRLTRFRNACLFFFRLRSRLSNRFFHPLDEQDLPAMLDAHRTVQGLANLHLRFERKDAVGYDLVRVRSEEHTSELQSRENLVCRLLLEKKKTYI